MGNEIFVRMANVMAKIDAIGKDKKNAQQGFSFRGIDDVYNAVHPLLAEEQIFMTTEVLSERSEERQTKSGGNLIYRILHIKYTFYTIDGSSVAVTVIGEGMDSGDKAANKAMAIGHKYALLQAFAIPTMDIPDPDSESHETRPRVYRASPPAEKAAQTDMEALGDVRNSKGEYSPEADPGEPATRGDGIAGKIRAIKVELGDIMASAYKDQRIFTKADADDMNADWHPGGRDLTASQNDLDLITGVRDKWAEKRYAILASHEELDGKPAEEQGLF